MNFYKEFFKLTFEIIFAIYIIFFGYIIWDNFDLSNYETAKYYDNIKEVELVINGDFNDYTHKNNIVLHNIGKKENNTNLLLKINKEDLNDLNKISLNINNKIYNINELQYKEDNNYTYYLINNSILSGYETKEINVEFINIKDSLFDYEFITNI